MPSHPRLPSPPRLAGFVLAATSAHANAATSAAELPPNAALVGLALLAVLVVLVLIWAGWQRRGAAQRLQALHTEVRQLQAMLAERPHTDHAAATSAPPATPEPPARPVSGALAAPGCAPLFDPLTGLPHRCHLDGALGATPEGAGVLLLIALDAPLALDACGEALLTATAQHLHALLAAPDTLVRLDGARFAWLVPCTPGAAADRAQQAAAAALPLSAPASIGWAACTGAAGSTLHAATLALQAAQAGGGARVQAFEPALLQAWQKQQTRGEQLRTALADPEAAGLVLHAQLLQGRQGQPLGAELLLRWQPPDGSSVPPARLLALARAQGLLAPLGHWVLEQACVRLAAWTAHAATRALALSINVDAQQFAQPDFADRVAAALQAAGAPARQLVLEITEAALQPAPGAAAATLAQLQALGVRVVLDDFGAGSAALAYLARLPLAGLKIAHGFVAGLPEAAHDARAVQAFIALAHGLGLQAGAKGVETLAQRDWLRAQGCDALQGFVLARPLPLPAYEAQLLGLPLEAPQ